MEEKAKHISKTRPGTFALNGHVQDYKSHNSMDVSLKMTQSGSTKSAVSAAVDSKGSNKNLPTSMTSKAGATAIEGVSGATPSGASMATAASSAARAAPNQKKSTSGSSTTVSSNTSVTRQPRILLPAAAKTTSNNASPLPQVGPSTGTQKSAPKVREFNVTHLSDNWKRRKAAKLAAALEREKNEIAAITQKDDKRRSSVASAATNIVSTTAPVTGTTTSREAQRAEEVDQVQSTTIMEAEEQENKMPPKHQNGMDLFLPFAKLKDGTPLNLQQIEKLLQDDKFNNLPKTFGEDSNEKSLDTNDITNVEDLLGLTEVTSQPQDAKSKDFDIDRSLSDTDPEDTTALPRSKNKTLMAYMTACAKNGLKPNPTFMRQCGRSSIDMRNRMLTYRDAKPMAIALVDDRRTSLLDLSDNPLGAQGTTCIAEMMYANESIVELDLSNTDPGSEGLSALAQTLGNNKNLRRLHLNNNKLLEGDGRHLAKIIMTAPDLRELNLNHTTLGFKDGTRLALALASDTSNLNNLSLQYNNLRTESAVQLALSLGKNTTLKSLNLAWNGFGAEGCRALAKSLGENNTLTELDLSNNRLGMKSLEHIIEGLKKNTSLKSVKFGINPLTTEGAKALVVALISAEESSIEEIDLRNIPIDQEFVDLTAALHEKRGVRVIHDTNIQMGTSNTKKEFDGDNLDRFDPVMVLFEYMKKDNLRVIDLFQFLDQKKRDKLSRKDIRDGVNILRLPFTEHALDVIMKTLDKNKDGFIQLDEMLKGYKENESIVKQRRIRANRKNKLDRGLEDLWAILKELIAKRKADNEKRSQEENEKRAKEEKEKRRQSLVPDARRQSLMPEARRQSILPGARKQSLLPGARKESLLPGARKESLLPGARKESLLPGARKQSLLPKK